MRTTVDIPDAIYRELKSEAALEGRSVKDVILSRVAVRPPAPAEKFKKPRFTSTKSKSPGSMKLGPEGVYEYVPFP